jgi:hypothetical protein
MPTNGFRNQIQRPAAMVNRTAGQFNTPGGLPLWSHPPQHQQQHISSQNPPPVRQPFVASERSLATSDRSNSAQEVEELLGSQGRIQRKSHYQGGWASTSQAQQQRGKPYILPLSSNILELELHTVFASSSGRRPSGMFRPGGKGK